MVSVINTAKGIALLALIIALVANVSGSIANSISFRDNCRKINNIYAQERLAAQREFRREVAVQNRALEELPKTAELLGIQLTQEAINEVVRLRDRTIKEAVIQRNKTLDEFAGIDCPLPILWGQ